MSSNVCEDPTCSFPDQETVIRQNARIKVFPIVMRRDDSIYKSVVAIVRVSVALTTSIFRLARNVDDRRRAVCIRVRR
jgi:hypothetical protein